MTNFFAAVVERDFAAILGDELGMAEDVVLAGHVLRALFEAPSVDVTPNAAHAPVLSDAPVLHVLRSHVMAAIGRELAAGDIFLVRGKKYRIQRPEDDGCGMYACKLLEEEGE